MSTTARRHCRLVVPFAVALAATAASALPANAIAGGTVESQPTYRFVVKLASPERACTGALIAPRWVLTANACFPGSTTPSPPSASTTVIVGRTNLDDDGSHAIAVTSVLPHPERGIVLARLGSEVTDVTPVEISTSAPQPGEDLQLAGYGRTDTEWVPSQLHATTATIESATASSIAVSSSAGPTTCKGDVGGPAVRDTDGQQQLVALHHTSWHNGCLGETETRQGATELRVDDLRDWLTQQTTNPITARYLDLGGSASTLGTAVGQEYAVADGRAQDYEHGVIYYSAATGAHDIQGAVLDHYQAEGGPTRFGFPTSNYSATPDGLGRYNHFSKTASIYWTPSTGAHFVQGQIRAKWAAEGWERSTLGYPTSDETATPDGVGRYNHFSKTASIYWTPNTGAHFVQGQIRAKWRSLGWERSALGYPTTDEFAVTGGRRNNFQHGYITWFRSSNTTQVTYT